MHRNPFDLSCVRRTCALTAGLVCLLRCLLLWEDKEKQYDSGKARGLEHLYIAAAGFN